MTTIKEHLNQAGIRLAPGKLELVNGQLSKIIRSPNLVPQPGRDHENVWQHTGSMLDENLNVFTDFSYLTYELDFPSTVGAIAFHDAWEGFTPEGDLNYANSAHNMHDLRRAKELAEYEAAHHFVDRNIIGKENKSKLHLFFDEWTVLESPLSLYIRIHDMVDGNISVIRKAMDLRNGVIQKVDTSGVKKIWPVAEAGAHIANIADTKTFPIVEKLVHRLKRKETSLAILDWFNQDMMKTYIEAGWGYLSVIQEMQIFLDKELKGLEL